MRHFCLLKALKHEQSDATLESVQTTIEHFFRAVAEQGLRHDPGNPQATSHEMVEGRAGDTQIWRDIPDLLCWRRPPPREDFFSHLSASLTPVLPRLPDVKEHLAQEYQFSHPTSSALEATLDAWKAGLPSFIR